MDILEVMKARHSVRQYADKPIEVEKREKLNEKIKALNDKSGLNIQVFYDEPNCFDSFMAHYGKFEDCNNYISLVGEKSSKLDELCGYYGEELVLFAQELGLNTCWVALTHGKSKASIPPKNKEGCIIAFGYGQTQGKTRKSKTFEDVTNITDTAPDWFKQGVEAALLAPTAMNQQKYVFSLNDETPKCEVKGIGSCTKIDLGIVEYHFDAITGKDTLNN